MGEEEFEKWKAEKAELEILLEQSDDYAHSLEGDMDIFHEEVSNLRNELMQAREARVQDSFF